LKFLVEIEGRLNENSAVFWYYSQLIERIYLTPTKMYILLDVKDDHELECILKDLRNLNKESKEISQILVQPIYEFGEYKKDRVEEYEEIESEG
jgi:hypothetical protein